jgi:hypothetical protein
VSWSCLYLRRDQGGELKLLDLTKKVQEPQITKLCTVFDVKEDETEVIKAFA